MAQAADGPKQKPIVESHTKLHVGTAIVATLATLILKQQPWANHWSQGLSMPSVQQIKEAFIAGGLAYLLANNVTLNRNNRKLAEKIQQSQAGQLQQKVEGLDTTVKGLTTAKGEQATTNVTIKKSVTDLKTELEEARDAKLTDAKTAMEEHVTTQLDVLEKKLNAKIGTDIGTAKGALETKMGQDIKTATDGVTTAYKDAISAAIKTTKTELTEIFGKQLNSLSDTFSSQLEAVSKKLNRVSTTVDGLAARGTPVSKPTKTNVVTSLIDISDDDIERQPGSPFRDSLQNDDVDLNLVINKEMARPNSPFKGERRRDVRQWMSAAKKKTLSGNDHPAYSTWSVRKKGSSEQLEDGRDV